MAPPLLTLQDIDLTFGGDPVLEGAGFQVGPRERLCLVGRNGSGKSTLLKIAAGLIEPDRGERFVQPGVTIRYLPQEPDFTDFDDTLSYVAAGLGPGEDPHAARLMLAHLGLGGAEKPGSLSGGEARRCALARVLAPEPDILLLDEPTNHLDLPAIAWLENRLMAMGSAMVMISHDRAFLNNLSRATLWIDRGRVSRLDRGFGSFEAWRDETLEEEERERHKLDRRIVREEHWLRYGVTARRKRNVRRLDRLQELRRSKRDYRGPTGTVTMAAAAAEASGKLVIEAEHISKAWDGLQVVKDVSLRIARGDRLGIVGPNGAGKTTLLNLITGVGKPDSGKLRLGVNLEMVTLDQHRESLDDNETLRGALTEGRGDMVAVGGEQRHVISYMKDFLFSPEQAGTPLSALSGGERGRLMLARALARPSNLLVLDEPTNDLDLETLDLLQELLAAYEGTVLLVSHDRDFLDRVVTSVIHAEGDGRWVEYAGGYSDIAAQRPGGAEAGAASGKADKPPQPAAKTPPPSSPPSRRRMTYRDKHALETLPGKIAELEARIEAVEAELGRPGFYDEDPDRFHQLSETLAELSAELGEAEEKWLELELLKEELGD